MQVIKRDKKTSVDALIKALDEFITKLRDQKEDDAIGDLSKAKEQLLAAKPESKQFKAAIDLIMEAFEGDHELMAYTYTREKPTEWTEADELSQTSSRVLNLARQLQQN